VLICGGGACIPGMRERLLAELRGLGTYGAIPPEPPSPPPYMPGHSGGHSEGKVTLACCVSVEFRITSRLSCDQHSC
jgi:hypothetical protein